MNLTSLLLTAGANGSQSGGSYSGILMIAVIIVIFYFFMIRPQRKRQKEEKNFRESLQKGQNIITIGGLHGKVREIKETSVIIEVANDVRIEVEKTAIAYSVLPNSEDKK
ncbi:MAG: preprotein translocase subunit YajC [Bacteroidales bacterium]|jgi:preprotein translocase subunit YajC|nr:preprotein translocase subunit YajC [Bacteroidales bacterium]